MPLRASQVPAPKLVPATALAWVDGSARYWQEENCLGAPLHCLAPLKTGQGSPWMVIGEGSGEGDGGIQGVAKCWVSAGGLTAPVACSSGWVGCLLCLWSGAWAISWWGDSTAPPGYFTLNTAKGWVLPLCFHSPALKEGVIGLPLIWQMGIQSKFCISNGVRFEAVCWVFLCELQFLAVWHSVMSEGICLPLSVSLALSAELTVTEWGKQALGCIGPTEILQMCCLI